MQRYSVIISVRVKAITRSKGLEVFVIHILLTYEMNCSITLPFILKITIVHKGNNLKNNEYNATIPIISWKQAHHTAVFFKAQATHRNGKL